MARQFSKKNPRIGIDIILFDAEDYGPPENENYKLPENYQSFWCLGSQYWSKSPHKVGYSANYGILLDMVGGENATFYFEATSKKFAEEVLNNVWRTGHSLGHKKHFIYQDSPQITDDHLFVNNIAKIPTIDIIEYNPKTKTKFNKHWHTHKDDMNNINKETLTAVGETLLNVIYRE